ncbi:MAG: ribonuclease catalytic domain-containing protein [Candidatus Bruticola sp.]
MISPGSYLEYIQDKKLLSAVCLRQDKPGKIFVRNARNREEKIADTKAMFVIPGFVDPNSSYDILAESLTKAHNKREELASQLKPEELWELLEGEEDDRLWGLDEICDLLLSRTDPEAMSAAYRSLDNDSIYFYRKGSGYIRRTSAQVQEIFQRRDAEALNRKEQSALSQWVSGIWNNPISDSTALTYPAEFEQSAKRLMRGFADVAVNGAESPRYKEINELFKSIEITRRDAPFQFMLKTGLWNEHENLSLYKYNISLQFDSDELQEALECTRFLDEEGNSRVDDERLDLTNLPCVTIDDDSTTDIDDAISFEEFQDGTFRVGIHIADASYYVKPESLVDHAALMRGTAIYLPDLKVPMCPEILSDSVCSLVAGKKRLSFSFLINFDGEFNITSSRMVSSVIKVDKRLTYDTANEELEKGHWSQLLNIVKRLKAKRCENGAMVVPFPRVNVKVKNSQIIIERKAPDSPSQLLVSELMILANSIAGSYLAEHKAPAIFRSQEAPEKPLDDLVENFDPVKAYNSRRFLKKGSMGLVPAHHTGLGLDSYVQVTSPIRRYNDLLMQRQLKSMLNDSEAAPMYSEEELGRLLAYTKQSSAVADMLERERKNYWILRYLEEHSGEEMEAIVLANHPDKHIVQLCGCLLENECPHVPGCPLPPGTHIHVKIDLVWPRDCTVRLSPIV